MSDAVAPETLTITIAAGQKVTQEGQKYELVSSIDVEALALPSKPPQVNKHEALVCPDEDCRADQLTKGKKKLVVVRATRTVLEALWTPLCGGCRASMMFVDKDELKDIKALASAKANQQEMSDDEPTE